MTAVNKLAVVPNADEMFDHVLDNALMKTDNEEAGEVMILTKVVDDKGNVDVLLMFPTEVGSTQDPDVAKYQPTGVRITLNVFLNAARMLAIEHQAVLSQERPEAFTDDNCPGSIIVPGRVGHG